MKEQQDIYEWIKIEESFFETQEIQVGDNWWFNFRRHIQMIFHLKNSQFFTGANDWMRNFVNRIEPILELCYWTEDLEVKDVTFFLEGEDDRALSFLVKKHHDEVYTREHDLDKLFDDITETDLDYGGVLVQKGVKRPEVVDFIKIAFCDQTDILGGPLGLKLTFSPDKLKQMSKYGWGEEKNGADISLQDLCVLAESVKDASGTLSKDQNQVPGKAIEVYVIRGPMPNDWLNDDGDFDNYSNQLQIRAFYQNENGEEGVCLYRKKDENNLKFFTFKEVSNRALGRGMGERLLGPQIWSNWYQIHSDMLLEAASKVPLVTDDPTYTNKNKIQDMENLEVTTIEEGKSINLVPTAGVANIQLFTKAVNDMYQHMQFTGQAFDSLMGKEESSGTTFKGQERLVAQGRGPHDRRRGMRAKFIEEIYRDWIIPDIVKEITKGKKFLATLSIDEISWVADQMATNAVNERVKEMVLGGNLVTKADQDLMIQTFKQDFLKGGNKRLHEIVKGEFEGKKLNIGINIAGKQKNLAGLSDKILSIFQFIITNPQGFQQAMQNPALSKSFNDILEYSGLSPVDYASLQAMPIPSPLQPTSEREAVELAPNES